MTSGLTFGSLFAGIGGFDLGLERAGLRCLWQCEIDPYCVRVLERHWPDVLRVRDIRQLRAGDVPTVDVLCGGFPCQDISYAGKGAGITGARSGLWSEYARLVGELRPRWVLVENPPALFRRGFGRVLGDLAALGYDAEWDCIPASAFGAPHRRDRVWIVAYPPSVDSEERERGDGQAAGWPNAKPGDSPPVLPDPTEQWIKPLRGVELPEGSDGARHLLQRAPQPVLDRVDDGIPCRMDRLRALGNSLVPQIAEWIGRRIVDYGRPVA